MTEEKVKRINELAERLYRARLAKDSFAMMNRAATVEDGIKQEQSFQLVYAEYVEACAAMDAATRALPPEGRLTVETFDGPEPAIPVAASWIIRRHDDQSNHLKLDHACAECVPEGQSVKGFRCYYHTALHALGPQPQSMKEEK